MDFSIKTLSFLASSRMIPTFWLGSKRTAASFTSTMRFEVNKHFCREHLVWCANLGDTNVYDIGISITTRVLLRHFFCFRNCFCENCLVYYVSRHYFVFDFMIKPAITAKDFAEQFGIIHIVVRTAFLYHTISPPAPCWSSIPFCFLLDKGHSPLDEYWTLL